MQKYIPVIEDEDATGDVADIYQLWKCQNPGRSRMPEVLKCYSHRPDFLKGLMEFGDVLHFQDGHLTREQKEMIGTYVSALNQCKFCVGVHSYFLDGYPDRETLAVELREGRLEDASLTDAERGLLEYCAKLTRASHTMTAEDAGRLRTLGWTDPQIAEAVYITGMYALFNRVANAFGLVDPDYRQMLGGKYRP